MGKKGEETARKTGSVAGSALAILLGTGIGLLLLLLLVLLSAGLIWSGSLPVSTASILLSVSCGLCALVGGRVAVRQGSAPMPAGAAVGGGLCLIFVLICLGTTGPEGFHGQFLGSLLLLLAGGCLAGLMGKRQPKRKKKKR